MTIAYPLPLAFLETFPGWTPEFDLLYRQEQSRTANGRTVVKDLGSPLWRMTAESKSLRPNELDAWRARLESLENGLKTFRAFSKSRCFPIKDPGGTILNGGPSLYLDFVTNLGYVAGPSAAKVYSINDNRKAIAVSGLRPGYVLSVGDMIQIGPANLHRVMESVIVDGTGRSPEFEIRPHLWPASAVNDAVTIVRPSCIMAIVPGSVSSQADKETGRGVVSFQAVEAR